MKEIKDIIQAFELANKSGKRTALATVVHVEGSSYRRPGARMLVTEDGELTGAISGGCLEGDALRKALLAIREGKNKLVTYDTTDEDDANFGIQLGCNGVVHILFEPVVLSNSNNPISLLKALANNRQKGVLLTLFDLHKNSGTEPGTCMLFVSGGSSMGDIPNGNLRNLVIQDAQVAFQEEASSSRTYLSDEFSYTAFIEFIHPVISLVILGGGNDAIPMVNMANLLGWHVTVIDGRPNYANPQRFPKADKVIVAKPEQVLERIQIDEHTVFILMSHNYIYDLRMLKYLSFEDTRYIGVLGPKRKLEKMMDELEGQGVLVGEAEQKKIYGPVGLDLGAETAEEIALSVIAEVKSIMSDRICQHLRDKTSPVHAPTLPGTKNMRETISTFNQED